MIFGASARGTFGWTESCPGPESLKAMRLALSPAAQAEAFIVVVVGRVVVVAIGYLQVVGIVVPAAAAIGPTLFLRHQLSEDKRTCSEGKEGFPYLNE